MMRPRVPVWQRRLGTPSYNDGPGMRPQGILDGPVRPPVRTPYERPPREEPPAKEGSGAAAPQDLLHMITNAQQKLQREREQILRDIKRNDPDRDPRDMPGLLGERPDAPLGGGRFEGEGSGILGSRPGEFQRGRGDFQGEGNFPGGRMDMPRGREGMGPRDPMNKPGILGERPENGGGPDMYRDGSRGTPMNGVGLLGPGQGIPNSGEMRGPGRPMSGPAGLGPRGPQGGSGDVGPGSRGSMGDGSRMMGGGPRGFGGRDGPQGPVGGAGLMGSRPRGLMDGPEDGPRGPMDGPGMMGNRPRGPPGRMDGGPREQAGGQMGNMQRGSGGMGLMGSAPRGSGVMGAGPQGGSGVMGEGPRGPGAMDSGSRGPMGGARQMGPRGQGQIGRGPDNMGPRDTMEGPGMMGNQPRGAFDGPGLMGSSPRESMGGGNDMRNTPMRGGMGVLGPGPQGPDRSMGGQSRFGGSEGRLSREPMMEPRGAMPLSHDMPSSSYNDRDRQYGRMSPGYREPVSRYSDPVDSWMPSSDNWRRDEFSYRDPLDDPLYNRGYDSGRSHSLIEDRRYQPQSYSSDPYDQKPLPHDYDYLRMPQRDYY